MHFCRSGFSSLTLWACTSLNSSSLLSSMYDASIKKLSDEIPRGICVAWIMEENGKIAGSGAITLTSMTPTPIKLNYITAYLHSVYVTKEFRGKSMAKLLLKEVENYCKENGIGEISLKASDAGKPIYESVGYKKVDNYMNLYLN